MDYEKIYNDLIESRKNRQIINSEYYETHHIIPKSLGGTNRNSNLIKLTAREHFLAHWLLYRIHKNQATAFAFYIMAKGIKGNETNRSVFSSIAYSEAKKAKSECVKVLNSKNKKGKPLSPITKQKLSVSLSGRKLKDSHKINISNSLRGKSKSIKARENISTALTGFNWSSYTERNHKIAVNNSGHKNGRARKILQTTEDGTVISQYNTMTDAMISLSIILGKTISKSTFHRLVTRNKQIGGFYWKYKV